MIANIFSSIMINAVESCSIKGTSGCRPRAPDGFLLVMCLCLHIPSLVAYGFTRFL